MKEIVRKFLYLILNNLSITTEQWSRRIEKKKKKKNHSKNWNADLQQEDWKKDPLLTIY